MLHRLRGKPEVLHTVGWGASSTLHQADGQLAKNCSSHTVYGQDNFPDQSLNRGAPNVRIISERALSEA